MSAAPSDVKLTLERTSSTLLQQIEALEKRTSELKRSREALEASHRPEEKERKEPRVKEVHEDGKSEEEDRSKLPQVVGDENKQAILVDPRRWARERLATHLREQGKELEQSGEHKEKEQKKPKAFDALGDGDGSVAPGIPKANAPGTMAKASNMMKGSAPNPSSMGAVAKGGPLPGSLGMPFQAKGAMPCGANGGILPKALGPCGGPAGCGGLGGGCGGCGMGGSMGSGMGLPGPMGGPNACGGGPDKGKEGEGDEMQQQVMLQMQMQMQMMMMGAMMGSMLGEGDDKEGKKSKKQKKAKKEGDDGLPPGSSNDMSHPSYRPHDMEQIPGVTDQRFEGRITMWLEDKGYGFIGNEELKQRFNGMDVFLHVNQKRHFGQGDAVKFSVFKNYRGQPQATELRNARPSLG